MLNIPCTTSFTILFLFYRSNGTSRFSSCSSSLLSPSSTINETISMFRWYTADQSYMQNGLTGEFHFLNSIRRKPRRISVGSKLREFFVDAKFKMAGKLANTRPRVGRLYCTYAIRFPYYLFDLSIRRIPKFTMNCLASTVIQPKKK